MRFWIELTPLAVAALAALFWRGRGMGRLERWARAAVPSQPRAIGLAFAITLALAALISAIDPPRPWIHDEHAYLLAADTFASGRLTNPPHPLWPHFESFHILQQPSYQAKYPPGQGLFLAAGQALTGRPIIGVWLCMALAAAALAWMAATWFSPPWALLAGLLPVLRFGTLGHWNGPDYAYWTNSYWGGGVALLGGALLFGGCARLARDARPGDGLLVGLGLALLANTRPYEGLVAALVGLGAVLLFRRTTVRSLAWALTPTALVVLGTLGAMAVYNEAVTGDPLRMPYRAYNDQYEVISHFVFDELKSNPPTYRHRELERFAREFQLHHHQKSREEGTITQIDAERYGSWFFGPALLLLLPFGLLCLRQPWVAAACALMALSVLAHLPIATSHFHWHYFAPAVPGLILFWLAGWRRLHQWRPAGRPIGPSLSGTLIAVVVFTFALAAFLRSGHQDPPTYYAEARKLLIETLQERPGKDLVLVRYAPYHLIHEEWVYNRADIDASEVAFARWMTDNGPLLDYFADRNIWLLEPDRNLLLRVR